MPRVDFKLWDRVYILKLIATAQMTFSSFMALLYLYLILMDFWTTTEAESTAVCKLRWIVIAVTCLDFGIGTLLAFAANSMGVRCRRRIVTWIVLETVYIPISIFLLMQLYYGIMRTESNYPSYIHLLRINVVQVCFTSCHYFFIGYAVNFLVHRKAKTKGYDPSIRPEKVDAPTDPQITTTESRHIRMCQSLLFQPSTAKGTKGGNDEGSPSKGAEELGRDKEGDDVSENERECKLDCDDGDESKGETDGKTSPEQAGATI